MPLAAGRNGAGRGGQGAPSPRPATPAPAAWRGPEEVPFHSVPFRSAAAMEAFCGSRFWVSSAVPPVPLPLKEKSAGRSAAGPARCAGSARTEPRFVLPRVVAGRGGVGRAPGRQRCMEL